jgi:hypothetical protein
MQGGGVPPSSGQPTHGIGLPETGSRELIVAVASLRTGEGRPAYT